MSLSSPTRIGIFALLAILMAATRLHHFGALPDASWAVFFLAGFYLRGSLRWAFPTLMALAVVVDYLVITGQGLNFWTHYCVSPAYWFLLPAYLSLTLGGAWLNKRYHGLGVRELGLLAGSAFVSISVCYLISNGSFYWLSEVVSEPSFAGWMKNLSDWYLPYLRTTGLYLGVAAAIHAVAAMTLRALGAVGEHRTAKH
ncbi:hypothetical protein [Rehaibacterium terrae]|jgi:hypothetical protein|uniref:Cobalamin ABC transporter n=1 Tax=Rehaibacterium terrae TaxID=1341696 RepID=A0A7W7Y1R5_9GAMM|nr:hypothetical protein [Rehaibacterium terrae]MBB5016509.1 hypothetical protein [Rehaibacterium terrae]